MLLAVQLLVPSADATRLVATGVRSIESSAEFDLKFERQLYFRSERPRGPLKFKSKTSLDTATLVLASALANVLETGWSAACRTITGTRLKLLPVGQHEPATHVHRSNQRLHTTATLTQWRHTHHTGFMKQLSHTCVVYTSMPLYRKWWSLYVHTYMYM